MVSVSLVIVFSCNNSADNEPEPEDSIEVEPQTLLWQASMNDSSGKMEMIKDKPAGLDSLSAEAVIEYLNMTNPNIDLQFARISGDTVYVRIPNALYLTQQMGSTGPTYYFASAVFNLTEVPGIRYVNFDFEEGDHAAPGVMSRESFKNE